MPAPVAVSGAATSAAPSTPAVQTSAGSKAPAGESKAPVTETKQPGGEAKPPPAEAPVPKRFKAKVKFDGKEQEIDLDESEVVHEIQKARHHDRTRGDFEKRQADFNAQMQALAENPLAFLADRGVDLTELAAQKAQRDAELAKLSPEARRAAELEAQLEQMRAAEQKRVDGEKKQAEQREHQERVQTVVRTIDGAIKLSGLKRSGELVKLYAEVMEMAEHAGEPSMSPEQLASAGEKLQTRRLSDGIKRAATDPAWRARNAPLMKELAQAILPELDGQELVDFVGRENAVKLAKAQLSLYRKNPIPTVAESQGEQPKTPPPPTPKREEPQSMFGMLDKLAGR